jgi:hypothetical protein
VLDSLQAKKAELQRGLMGLPPERNLRQYYSDSPPHMVWCDTQNPEKGLRNLQFAGSDPLAWLTAAYQNAHELITISEALILECLKAKSLTSNQELFELDPPHRNDDPRVPILKDYIDYFQGMTVEEVLRVFDARKGVLSMSGATKWKNCLILEAIRRGLDIKPRTLRNIFIKHKNTALESWLTASNVELNRCGSHVNSARSKGIKDLDTLELLTNKLINDLSKILSP